MQASSIIYTAIFGIMFFDEFSKGRRAESQNINMWQYTFGLGITCAGVMLLTLMYDPTVHDHLGEKMHFVSQLKSVGRNFFVILFNI